MAYLFSTSPKKVSKVETRYRLINSDIPCAGTAERISELEKVEARSMQGQLPIIWNRAKGFNVWDIAGNCFIDFTSTIFVANVGHGNQHVIKRIKECLDRPLLHTYAYANPWRIDYHKELIRFAGHPFEKAFLMSSGSEAVEAGIKLAKMHGQISGRREQRLISHDGNWHGRTMGAQLLSTNTDQKKWIGERQDSGIYLSYPLNVPEENAENFFLSQIDELAIKGINIQQEVCGFVLETMQGWSGRFYPVNYVKAIRDFTKQNNMILAFDEMQTGFGRTGKKFGFEHYEIKPDMIFCGKGIASGFPLSAVLGSAALLDLPKVGNMSSTHSANPLACAAGLATIEELQSKHIVQNSEIRGRQLKKALMGLKDEFSAYISEINCKGLIGAIVLSKDIAHMDPAATCSQICELCMQKGLLIVCTGRESIKIAPPLLINKDAFAEGLDVFCETTREVLNGKIS